MLRALLLLLLVMAAPAAAQSPFDRKPGEVPDSRTFQPRDLERDRAEIRRTANYLAYTLGELHYLSFACVSTEDQQWRDRMIELLALEPPDGGGARSELIQAFNDGYAEQQRYRRRCGFESEAERRALAHRGRDLSEMMRRAYFD